MQPIPDTFSKSCSRKFAYHIIRQGLFHAHHLLHEATVHRESWQQGENAIPVQKVVVNAPADQAEHMSEDLIVGCYLAFGNFQHSTKLAVNSLIGGEGKRESEWSGNAAVAFRDVAVVPDIAGAIRVRKLVQRANRAGLKHIKISALNCPFDVLRASQAARDLASHCRDSIRLLVVKHTTIVFGKIANSSLVARNVSAAVHLIIV